MFMKKESNLSNPNNKNKSNTDSGSLVELLNVPAQ